MQTMAKVGHHGEPLRRDTIKKTDHTTCWLGRGATGTLTAVGGNVKTVHLLPEKARQHLSK